MRNLVLVINLVLLITVSKFAMADDKVEPMQEYSIPDGVNHSLDGVKGVFFTTEEYKTIGLIYVDYKNFWAKKKRFEEKELNLRLDIERLYDLRIETCLEGTKIATMDRDYWKMRFGEIEGSRKRDLRIRKIREVAMWILIGVETVGLAGLAIHDALD